ncbi:hypothetical protein ILYODFUR_015218 [Ilyodon furcidens]|uniref:Uncharacterized protein n=1 Tax=Ilyodon furcidens TaxID=33524 RepID=A0ABV0U8L8_9TELE
MGCTLAQYHCCLAARRSWIRLPARGLSAWSLHVLPTFVGSLQVLQLPPQSKNITVRLIGFSIFPLGVNECVRGCLSCVSLCCPATDWRSVQGVPRLSPVDCWRLAPAPLRPTMEKAVEDD